MRASGSNKNYGVTGLRELSKTHYNEEKQTDDFIIILGPSYLMMTGYSQEK
uniref:Uncharacterized protein n=1 Tax=Arion vulgaris TaxID=1028688 RepID=A0A0B6ZQB3_9EUPU